ncbi:MAG: hypothetical protein CK536_05790 [Synechococcus sp. Baikal-G1]|nr:MAG: hypothetical protein CK536_05790 [Synechococcus sp. Baikal-G1]
MHPNSSPLAEAERQLELQRQLIVALTPELYRQQALYLQVLRKGLLHAVQQACFYLATQTYPERFGAIGANRRLELQERLQALVQRCNCLLTVEQLMGLASQLQSRQQRQRRRDQQRLLLALAADNGDDDAGEVDGEAEGQGGGLRPGDSRDRSFGPHRGSVHLGLDLPLSADLFGSGLDGLGAWLAGFEAKSDAHQSDPEQDPVQEKEVEEAEEQEAEDQEAEEQEQEEQEVEQEGEVQQEVPQASAQPAEGPGRDPDQPLPPLDPGGEPGLAAAVDQVSDPADPASPPGPGASDGPRRPRRPPFQRGPGPSGGRQRSVTPEGSTDDFQFFQSLFALAAEGLGRETPGLANPGSASAGQAATGQASSGQASSGQAESGPRQFGEGESDQGPAKQGPDGPADALVPSESPAPLEGGERGLMAIRLDRLRQAGGLGQAQDSAGWQALDSLMPQDAPSLLAWWEALDGALQRRLRNLSNAVNGELLRLGITRSHLPIALLDAVLKGQLDPLPAPANLVRLQMPFGGDGPASHGAGGPGGFPFGGPLDMVALLLRPTDLEFETPSLRVCRRRLEQNRARLRTMAQRHRYWQRRVQALEAERQWFQDSPPTSREPA